MKMKLFFPAILLIPGIIMAQPGVPHDVESALARIEHAFQSSNPASIEDLLPMSMLLRLGDSLYLNVSRITALDLLKRFFSDRDSVQFHFFSTESGVLIYSQKERRDTVNVDVWFSRPDSELVLHALNISNLPRANVFTNTRR